MPPADATRPPPLPSPWSDGRALYHLHSLGASGAPDHNPAVDDPAVTGDGLEVLRRWLPHVADLGAGGVLLTPILVSSTHGYDTVDPFRIDQRLGSADDFDAFVTAAHDLDLRVVLDGVFNHVGRDFGRFREVLEGGPTAPAASWFRIDASGGGEGGDGFGYVSFEGHRQLVALNHRNPDVAAWAVEVMRHWLDRGADGWRLDAAYAIPRDFLAEVTGQVRGSHPDALIIGEVIHGDYGDFVATSGVHTVTQYELHKAVWSSLRDANFFELHWALERHRQFAESFVPQTFVGNHDVTRIASHVDDPGRRAAAVVLLGILPGLPSIYYGDELGWAGVKEDRMGGDDAIRPRLPARADAADAPSADAVALHRDVLALRRAHPWLTDARLEPGGVTNTRIDLRVSARADGDERTLRLTLDLEAPSPPPCAAGWRPLLDRPGVLVEVPA